MFGTTMAVYAALRMRYTDSGLHSGVQTNQILSTGKKLFRSCASAQTISLYYMMYKSTELKFTRIALSRTP